MRGGARGEYAMKKRSGFGRDLLSNARMFVRGPVGLGLFLAWFYCVFYSCVLVQNPYTVRESERYWAVSLAVAALVSVCLFACMRRGRRVGGMRSWSFAASSCAAVASVFIYSGYIVDPIDARLALFGAVLAGAALPFLMLLWLSILRECDEGVIEFSVPAAFLVSLLVYLPVVAAKNAVSAAIVACLPILSVAVAMRVFDHDRRAQGETRRTGLLGVVRSAMGDGDATRKGIGRDFYRNATGLWKTGVLFMLLWFNFAFFRSCVSPTYFTDRFDHYLVPFICAGAMAACIIVFTLRTARSVGLFTTYRWVLPSVLAGYALLFIGDAFWGRFSFTASFIGLVGMQLCFFIVVAKYARTNELPVGYVFLPLYAFIGVGTACGVACGMRVLDTADLSAAVSYLPLLMVVLVAAVMAWGCDADRLIERPERVVVEEMLPETEGRVYTFCSSGSRIIDSVAVGQARALALRYGLSPREQEILGYLLAGRSRPFVRDELVLSLNTVNTHVRNIYAKVGVHSQQELLTLARAADGDRRGPNEEARSARTA
ncbi:hypothetical protein GJG86_06310 [Eggerthella sp. HF-4214]|uniref:HTH luxR-type domain-containing protein n=2 Tax=Eggerthella guodeyinii TaxID=2690837 RepID=A0A6N7RM46_9ACTN|nr:hypothetical protein [Eggerthella guodeyinii]